MSARDELAALIGSKLDRLFGSREFGPAKQDFDLADELIAAGYSKPRTITTAEELEKLPYGSAVQTSDETDTVVLKDKGAAFRNQSGCELSATDLWRFGTHPFTLIYSPEES
jgi:hypothetical protein